MKFLSSMWFLAILAICCVIGTVSFRIITAATTPVVLPDTKYDSEVDGRAVAALWNTQTGYVEQLSLELQQGLSDLKHEKEGLQKERNRLKNEGEELKRLQEEIENTRKHLANTITAIETSEVKNLRSQATVYSNMDAANTVKVFDTMDNVEVVKILYFMGSDIQSEIYQAMIAGDGNAPLTGLDNKDNLTGAEKVARLNEMLKFTMPPKKK